MLFSQNSRLGCDKVLCWLSLTQGFDLEQIRTEKQNDFSKLLLLEKMVKTDSNSYQELIYQLTQRFLESGLTDSD